MSYMFTCFSSCQIILEIIIASSVASCVLFPCSFSGTPFAGWNTSSLGFHATNLHRLFISLYFCVVACIIYLEVLINLLIILCKDVIYLMTVDLKNTELYFYTGDLFSFQIS